MSHEPPSLQDPGAHQVCPLCAGVSPSGARFCMQCGTALAGVRGEERRNVTVLFADVSGFTTLSERLDAENVRQVIDACLRRLAEEVEVYGGIVDKFIGDAIMALFGATRAHGDDPLRAVRTAVAMQASLEDLNGSLGARYGTELALSIGVNTGEVVTGSVADRFTVTGDAVNVAARLQDAATAGQILVGDRTYRATRGEIDYRYLSALPLKGKTVPVPAWIALAQRDAQLHRHPGSGRRLVGREAEVGRLLAACNDGFSSGRCTGVTVLGEAGIGKSSLRAEVAGRLERDAGVRVLVGACPAYGARTGFAALAQMVRVDCGVTDADERRVAAEKVRDRVDTLVGVAAPHLVGPGDVMTHLLGLADGPLGEDTDAVTVRERMFATVTAWATGLASERPTVLAFEDMHWAAETLGDLVDFLLEAVRGPLVILTLARPDVLHRGPGRVRAAVCVELEPLAGEDAVALVRGVLQGGGDTDLARSVALQSGGNPLFAEELARSVEEGTRRAVAELPDTVQGLLAARIDDLAPLERTLVQEASVLGHTFDLDLLELVTDAATVAQTVGTLQARGILAEQFVSAERRHLSFRHVLICDVAYAMLSIAGRSRRHERVAATVARSAHGSQDHVSMRADHLVRAADLAAQARFAASDIDRLQGLAVPSLEAAAQAAAARGAHLEAVARLEDAVRLATDPDDGARLREALGDSALGAGRTDRAAAAWQDALTHHLEAGDVVAGARLHRRIAAALAEHGDREGATAHLQSGIGVLRDSGPTLELAYLYEAAAWMYAEVGQDMLAIHAAEKALSNAQAVDAVRAASRTHAVFGVVLGRVGQTDRARENLERAVELSAAGDAGATIATLSLLGEHYEAVEHRVEEARTRYARALALASEHGYVARQVELLAALIRIADDPDLAGVRARQATELARGVPSAVAAAAALEAQALAGLLDDRCAALDDAAERWAAAGRPFDAARCRRSAVR